MVFTERSNLGPTKGEYGEQKTCRWSGDSNAKLSARIFGLTAQACEAAEGMKHNFFDFYAFETSHQGVREFMAKDRYEQAGSRNHAQQPGSCGRERWQLKTA